MFCGGRSAGQTAGRSTFLSSIWKQNHKSWVHPNFIRVTSRAIHYRHSFGWVITVVDNPCAMLVAVGNERLHSIKLPIVKLRGRRFDIALPQTHFDRNPPAPEFND
jgi:hypothetical protein